MVTFQNHKQTVSWSKQINQTIMQISQYLKGTIQLKNVGGHGSGHWSGWANIVF